MNEDSTAASGTKSANRDGVARTLGVLERVCEVASSTLTEISTDLGLSPATTLRFLRALEIHGYVSQSADQSWRATSKMWRLGMVAVSQHDDLNRSLMAVLTEIAELTGESAVYSHFENGYMYHLLYAPSPHRLRTSATLGQRHHVAAVNSGLALLATMEQAEAEKHVDDYFAAENIALDQRDGVFRRLDEAKINGYAFTEQSNNPSWNHIWGIAVPLLSVSGRPVGAVAITGPLYRRPDDPGVVADVLLEKTRSLSFY